MPSLRLAWIPKRELLTTGLLFALKGGAAVQQLVEEALESQTRAGGKRRRMAEPPPDQSMCPITHEIMSDPVFVADGHPYMQSISTSLRTFILIHSWLPQINLSLHFAVLLVCAYYLS